MMQRRRSVTQHLQYTFINMAAISWIKRKTVTHKQRHAFKITLQYNYNYITAFLLQDVIFRENAFDYCHEKY